MKTKKIIIFIFCITIFYTHAMEEDNDMPRSETTVLEQQRYNAWEEVKQTQEFALCAELTQLQRRGSDPIVIEAFNKLHEIQAFKKYLSIGAEKKK
jgi:hypothetical protein